MKTSWHSWCFHCSWVQNGVNPAARFVNAKSHRSTGSAPGFLRSFWKISFSAKKISCRGHMCRNKPKTSIAPGSVIPGAMQKLDEKQITTFKTGHILESSQCRYFYKVETLRHTGNRLSQNWNRFNNPKMFKLKPPIVSGPTTTAGDRKTVSFYHHSLM